MGHSKIDKKVLKHSVLDMLSGNMQTEYVLTQAFTVLSNTRDDWKDDKLPVVSLFGTQVDHCMINILDMVDTVRP